MKYLIGLVGGLALLGSAQAKVISYDFTATVDHIREVTPDNYLGLDVSSSNMAGSVFRLGDTVHGRIEYDTSTGLSTYQPLPQAYGSYVIFESAGAKNSLSSTFSGAQTLPTHNSDHQLQVANNASDYNGGDLFAIELTHSTNDTIITSYVKLQDDHGTWLKSDGIPQELSLAGTTSHRFDLNYFFYTQGKQLDISGDLTSLSLTSPVPEPSGYLMLAAGLGLLGWRRRKALQD